jgi:voltage-gated potassium channel
VAQRKAILEAQIASALEDGEIDSDEQIEIENLRKRFDISEDHVKAIIKVLKEKSSAKK